MTFSIQILRLHIFRSARKTARNKNRGFFCDAVVKSSGGIDKDFLSWETRIWKENGVRKVPEGTTTHQGTPGRAGAPWCIMATSVAFLIVSYFPNFSNILKLTEFFFADFSESVYLPYHEPPLFRVLECSGRFLLRGPPVSWFG
jgi:hypothetical protein